MNNFCIAAIYPLTDDQGDTKFILEIPDIEQIKLNKVESVYEQLVNSLKEIYAVVRFPSTSTHDNLQRALSTATVYVNSYVEYLHRASFAASMHSPDKKKWRTLTDMKQFYEKRRSVGIDKLPEASSFIFHHVPVKSLDETVFQMDFIGIHGSTMQRLLKLIDSYSSVELNEFVEHAIYEALEKRKP